jgi:hypothetical protein
VSDFAPGLLPAGRQAEVQLQHGRADSQTDVSRLDRAEEIGSDGPHAGQAARGCGDSQAPGQAVWGARPAMITGSNTNVRHGGKLFHVQTEDSGLRNPHVISHLYFGGTILASEKTKYNEMLDLESELLAKDVRALIAEQHKSMLKKLKRGEFDAVIAERLGGAPDENDTANTAEKISPPTAPAPTLPVIDEPEAPQAEAAGSAPARAFGDGIVSQKPLDEVILEYLVEKARDRVGDRESKAAGRSRKKE